MELTLPEHIVAKIIRECPEKVIGLNSTFRDIVLNHKGLCICLDVHRVKRWYVWKEMLSKVQDLHLRLNSGPHPVIDDVLMQLLPKASAPINVTALTLTYARVVDIKNWFLLAECLPKLERLNVNRPTSAMAGALQRFTSLLQLRLSGARLVSSAAVDLFDSLSTLSALKHLAIHQFRLTHESLHALHRMLRSLPSLQRLELRHMSREEELNRAFADMIVETLKKLTGTLHSLNISENKLGGLGDAAIYPSLRQLSGLKDLHVKSNRIGRCLRTSTAFSEGIQVLTGIQSLNLDSNELGNVEGLAAIASGLCHLACLQDLSLSNNAIGGASAAASVLAPALFRLTGLTRLCFNDNNLGVNGASVLFSALELFPREIERRGEHHEATYFSSMSVVSPEGCVTAGLQHHLRGLQSLHLVGNSLGAEGAVILGHALKDMPQLTELDISYNGLGTAGASALADGGLENCRGMHCLNLGLNKLGAKSMEVLAPVLISMTRLSKLDLRNNDLAGPDGTTALASVMEHLTELKISC